jgi:hypothetical protein
LSAYPVGSSVRFSALLQEHDDDRTWDARYGVSADELHQELRHRVRQGMVPTLLAGFLQDADSLYTAVWTNKAGPR